MLLVTALGHKLHLWTARGLFSLSRMDEGTRLLFANLPSGAPRRVLDMGCGYGALGLPLAARFPGAEFHLVDRLLLAVRCSSENARENGLANVRAYPSLGYADVDRSEPFDWILCNVPARIGGPFFAHLLEGALELLAPEGELRLVVIRDRIEALETTARERGLPLARAAEGPRHAVFSLARGAAGPARGVPLSDWSIYTRGRVAVPLVGELERPFDVDDPPAILDAGLPLLCDVLPRTPPARALFVRAGWGPAPLAALARWGGGNVFATDPDLLAVTFARLNAARAGPGARIEVHPRSSPPRSPALSGSSSPSASSPRPLARPPPAPRWRTRAVSSHPTAS